MSNEPKMAPHFDDHFWNNVQIRVENVRDLTRAELAQAAHDLLAVEVEAEVVPVFPSPFWNRVNKRAASVRTMALDELADAEERLVNGPEAAVPSWRSRIPVPAMLRRIPRPRQAGLPQVSEDPPSPGSPSPRCGPVSTPWDLSPRSWPCSCCCRR
jgi:hypothetical protein